MNCPSAGQCSEADSGRGWGARMLAEDDAAGGGDAGGASTGRVEGAEAAPAGAVLPPFREVLSWVACDKCEKWRQLSEESLAQYEDKAFHCSYLPGVDCDTPEEAFSDPVDAAALNSGKPGKVVFCPSCRAPLERGHRGREKVSSVLERHYRVLPLCRPLEATTPETVVSLIVDLSDRLPYRAVEHEAPALLPAARARGQQPGPSSGMPMRAYALPCIHSPVRVTRGGCAARCWAHASPPAHITHRALTCRVTRAERESAACRCRCRVACAAERVCTLSLARAQTQTQDLSVSNSK